uniref:Bacterial ubiquitin-like modifier n=1 Tax=Ascaris lumbricoides TaxID=6252 RepID=A0A0M3HG21_ASCLU
MDIEQCSNRRDSPKKRRRARLHDSETASDQGESIAVEEVDLNRTNPNLNDVLGMLAEIGEIDYDPNRSEHSQ